MVTFDESSYSLTLVFFFLLDEKDYIQYELLVRTTVVTHAFVSIFHGSQSGFIITIIDD
jgi:hypothetical protein